MTLKCDLDIKFAQPGHYSGLTMTMDLAMDQCLQSDARQSHSLVAEWIVK